MKPIFVVGVGRSGTSTVARLLHTEFGICMGQRFREPDEKNEKGYYEDLDLKSLNEQFLIGALTNPSFITALENELAKPWRQKIQWGFKDPRLCELGGIYFTYLQPIVIRCCRPKEQVIKSLQRCYGLTEQDASRLFDRREVALDNLLYRTEKKTITFGFGGKRKTDKEIRQELTRMLKGNI